MKTVEVTCYEMCLCEELSKAFPGTSMWGWIHALRSGSTLVDRKMQDDASDRADQIRDGNVK